MKCFICDKDLSEKEIIYNDDIEGYEPCTTCLEIALDAAYSDGFQKEDDEMVLIEPYDDTIEYELYRNILPSTLEVL